MDAWEAIVESESEEVYVDSLRLFTIVCTNFPKFWNMWKVLFWGQ